MRVETQTPQQVFPPIIGRFAHEHVTDVVESRAFVDSVAA